MVLFMPPKTQVQYPIKYYAHVPDQGQDLKIDSKIHSVQHVLYQIVHICWRHFLLRKDYFIITDNASLSETWF